MKELIWFLNNDGKFSAVWNKNNIGTINVGDDTLIVEDNRTFRKLIDKVFENRNKTQVIKDQAILDNLTKFKI